MIRILRRVCQILAFLIILAIPYLNSKELNIAGNLYSSTFFGIDITDPLIFLQNVILNRSFDLKFFLSIAIPVIIALVLGKVFCSYLCPVNTVFEWLNKLYPRKNAKHVKGNSRVTFTLLLVVTILVVFTKFPIFTYLSLPGIFSLEMQKVVLSKTFSFFWLAFIFLILLDFILKRRFWCNYICPQGGFIGFLKTPRTLKVVKNKDKTVKCTGCGKCVSSCPLYLNPMEENIYPQCYNCLECVQTCKKIHKDYAPLNIKF